MQRKALYDVLEVEGGPLGEPVRFLPELAPAGDPKEWKLAVMNAQGEVVRALSGEGAPPGVILWDGRTGEGREVNGGERYQYQLEVAYADGSRTTSARRVFGVNRSETIYLGFAVSAFRFDSAELSPRGRTALEGWPGC
jgi:hypothetical protein